MGCGVDGFCHAAGDALCSDAGFDAGFDAGVDAGTDAGECPGQLLINPDFESGQYGPWNPSNTNASVDNDARTGQHAAKFCSDGTGPQIFVSDSVFTPVAGVVLHATVWMKDAPGTNGSLLLREFQTMTLVDDTQDTKVLTPSWQKLEVTYTIKSSASTRLSMVMESKPPDAGCIHVDDLCLQRVQ